MMGTLHFLPRLQHLVVIYADPNVETPCQTNAACDRCQNLGRSRTSVRFHKGPYADSKDKDKSHPPDLIAGVHVSGTAAGGFRWR